MLPSKQTVLIRSCLPSPVPTHSWVERGIRDEPLAQGDQIEIEIFFQSKCPRRGSNRGPLALEANTKLTVLSRPRLIFKAEKIDLAS